MAFRPAAAAALASSSHATSIVSATSPLLLFLMLLTCVLVRACQPLVEDGTTRTSGVLLAHRTILVHGRQNEKVFGIVVSFCVDGSAKSIRNHRFLWKQWRSGFCNVPFGVFHFPEPIQPAPSSLILPVEPAGPALCRPHRHADNHSCPQGSSYRN